MAKKPIVRSGKNIETDNLGIIMSTMADTTWRMFVPSVGFVLMGVWLDGQFDTKPWLMFAGIVLGFIGAYLLVANQLGTLKRKKEREK